MKYIKKFEKYTPTSSITNMMKSGNYRFKHTDYDFKYKIGQFVRLLDKNYNRKNILDDDIYEIILHHLDNFGTEHYRLKKVSGVPCYLDEFWQVEKNKLGNLMFEPLSSEEVERFELKKNANKYNI